MSYSVISDYKGECMVTLQCMQTFSLIDQVVNFKTLQYSLPIPSKIDLPLKKNDLRSYST